jgi:hypothetical protein
MGDAPPDHRERSEQYQVFARSVKGELCEPRLTSRATRRYLFVRAQPRAVA